MNLNDFIIIYLACGSPVGFWFYFNKKKSENILIKSFLVALFWIFFIVTFVYNKSAKRFEKLDETETIRKFQKEIEQLLSKNISVFEFREISNRYIGLMLLGQIKKSSHFNNELSARFNSRNKELSAKCLQRQNHKKIKLHQTHSRKDFLQTICGISEQIVEPTEFLNLNLGFVNCLNDIEAENFISELVQIQSKMAVNKREKELWNNEQLNLPITERTNFHLRASAQQTIPMTTKD